MNHRLLPILTLLALAALPAHAAHAADTAEPRNLLTFEGSKPGRDGPHSGNRRRAPGEPRPGGALRQPARRAARREGLRHPPAPVSNGAVRTTSPGAASSCWKARRSVR